MALSEIASLAVGAVAAAALPEHGRAPAPPVRAPVGRGRYESVAVTRWWLLEVGPHARSLVIECPQGDGCSLPAKATVSESRTGIQIELRQRIYVPGPGESCTTELKISRLTIALRSPVTGRAVLQPGRSSPQRSARAPIPYLSRYVPDPPYSDVALPLVPRVVGLSPADATRVLRQEGVHAVVHGHGIEVTGQSPQRGHVAPGSTAAHPFAGVVQLMTSR